MTDTLIYPNGIDAETGEPLLPAMPPALVAELAKGNPISIEELKELQARNRCLTGEADYGTMAGIDSNDLAQTGWGVIFAFDDRERVPAIREALAPLLELRRGQAGALYRDELLDPKFFYRPGEASSRWLSRNGGAPGQPVDPKKTPYYLLIVGDPDKIPYRFQYQLDVTHAVGRIHFETLDEYHSYARSVVAAEDPARPLALARDAVFFGVHNERDRATALSTEHLVTPLTKALEDKLANWRVQRRMEGQASKDQLARLLGGAETPAFLFSASHGMGFSTSGHPRQQAEQGAIVCSDWSGAGPVGDAMRFSAGDIGSDARLLGLIAFLFACFGAGTPQYDDFAISTQIKELQDRGLNVTGLEQLDRIPIAPQPFVARLPQRLLGHPKGGALAVVGHVDRAWGSSFLWEGAEQVTTFESTLTKLLQGDRLGFATEDFNNRYAGLSTELNVRLEDSKFGAAVPPEELAGLWTANNDARSYVVLGDPAVRLAVGPDGAPALAADRPAIESITLRTPPAAPGAADAATALGTVAPSAARPVAAAATATGALEARTAAEAAASAAAFGVLDGSSVKATTDRLLRALQDLAERVGAALGRAVDNVATLEVKTYVSDNMAQVPAAVDQNARLRAYTHITFDGDTTVCVPTRQEGEIDQALWAIHLDMVRQAQANRTEMLKAAVAAASGLVDALKGA